MLREPALLTSAGMDAEAKSASSDAKARMAAANVRRRGVGNPSHARHCGKKRFRDATNCPAQHENEVKHRGVNIHVSCKIEVFQPREAQVLRAGFPGPELARPSDCRAFPFPER